MGVPVGMAGVGTTRPYYRSGYVFVSRRDRNLDIHSLDDPRLRALQIGVNTLGDSDGEVPPVHALVTRGIVRNLVSYNIFGALEEANPGLKADHGSGARRCGCGRRLGTDRRIFCA